MLEGVNLVDVPRHREDQEVEANVVVQESYNKIEDDHEIARNLEQVNISGKMKNVSFVKKSFAYDEKKSNTATS
ncbi:hypothetical protein DOY81_010623 [Sarcophaga bullata]|nr:hypothetical protein DOY81_010623 [Sarcophaga bullata]